MSAVVLWALSQGRIPELVFLSGLPWLAGRLWSGFTRPSTLRSRRWAIGAAIGLAVLASFFPGTLLAVLILVIAGAIFPPLGAARLRGVGRATAVVVGATLLLFPLAIALASAGGDGLGAITAPVPFGQILRLSPGAAPGAWVLAYYLPVAAALCLILVSGPARRAALRAGLASLASVYLGWAAANGWLPLGLSNPAAYVGVAAFCDAVLVGLGLASLAAAFPRTTFGYRQLAGGVLTILVSTGLLAQAAQAGRGAWAVGQGNVPAAYALVGDAPGPAFRVLFVGRSSNQALVPPGGEVQGTVPAGAATIRFAVTGPQGASALDFARPAAGPGYHALVRAVGQVLSGSTVNGGALLAPFAIRYVVASPRDLSASVVRTLRAQVDFDQIPAGGLTIFRDAATLGTAAGGGPTGARAAFNGSRLSAARVSPSGATPLAGGGQSYRGEAASRGSAVMLAQQFDGWWRLRAAGAGASLSPARAFGWSVGFDAPKGLGAFDVRYGGQWIRTVEVVLLTLLWAVALWITRRPARG